MYFAKYLLSIEELIPTVNEICSNITRKEGQSYTPALDRFVNSDVFENRNRENGEALMERAFFRVDDTRRRKAEGLKQGRAKAACLGAGLLLQLAVGERNAALKATDNQEEESAALEDVEKEGEKAVSHIDQGRSEIKKYSVSQLLACVEDMPRFSFHYTYGEKGKPYFQDLPFYFNLSHSGNYVLCGLSDVEVGADIQQHCGKDVGKLARRFFSKREADVLEQAGEEREKLFYRLWARKEAYGKLTGKGIAEVLEVDMLHELGISPKKEDGGLHGLAETTLSEREGLIWEESEEIEGYSIAFCHPSGFRRLRIRV